MLLISWDSLAVRKNIEYIIFVAAKGEELENAREIGRTQSSHIFLQRKKFSVFRKKQQIFVVANFDGVLTGTSNVQLVGLRNREIPSLHD